MAIRIAQKSCKALFPLWSLKKKIIEIDKLKYHPEERLKALEKILILSQTKR